MNNKYTQDMAGTGQHVELPDPGPEPERYNDWILWKLRQSPEYHKAKLGNRIENKNEFQTGIFEVFKNLLKGSSLTLAVIYTLGHIIIAANVVYWVTGATIWEAGAVALIEPAINGVWFYALHKIWIHVTKD